MSVNWVESTTVTECLKPRSDLWSAFASLERYALGFRCCQALQSKARSGCSVAGKLVKRRRITILIVEDDANDQLIILRAFRHVSENESIHLVPNGAEAIAYLKGDGKYSDRTQYDLPTYIVTNLRMPVMDGFELLQRLKSNPKWATIPVIVLSGSVSSDVIERAYASGAASFFAKPQSYDELHHIVKNLSKYWKEAEFPEIVRPPTPD
jgi:CheY-like chemotaxis protein